MTNKTRQYLGLARLAIHVVIAGVRRTGRWLVRARGGAVGAVSRVSAALMSIVGVCLVGMALTSPVAAYANAANPAPDTTANVAVNSATGQVTISLSGTWNWPGQDCAGRYGEGWSVDWWGVSNSATPDPNFTLSDATEVVTPGTTTTGDLSFGGDIVTPTGQYFHVGQYYAGEDVNTASTCTDTAFAGGGGSGSTGSTGPWSAQATYPSAADVPAQLCVIMYDEHGREGASSNQAKDFSPTGDHDNSIQTNAFNPTVGAGFCFSSNFTPQLSVTKSGPTTGNPNGTGTYTLQVTNNGNAPASNVPVTDTLPVGESYVSSDPSICEPGGSAVSGSNPGVGQTITCTVAGPIAAGGGKASFTVTVDFLPNTAGETLTDCATVAGQANPSCQSTTIIQQSLSGHIYLCDNGTQTTNEVPGGSLGATGPQDVASATNPLSVTGVPAGDYTLTATAPDSFQLVGCGGAASGPTFSTETVTVPSGGTGNGIFYVTPITQALIGHIYLCEDGTATTIEVNGGLISASGPQVLSATANPFSAPAVTAGSYIMSATAPKDYHFVACGTDNQTIGAPPTNAEETVNVPSGGTGTGLFYVQTAAPAAPSITLGVSKTNDADGSSTFSQTETATGPGESVRFEVVVTNTSTVPVTLTNLTDSWPGEAPFSPVCSNAALVGTTLQPGGSAACDFTVANYAPPAGSSLTDTVNVTGCQSTNTDNCTTVPATSTVVTPPAPSSGTGAQQGPPPAVTQTPATAAAPAKAAATPTRSLAFTGAPARLKLLLEIGFALMSCGMFALWFSRPRHSDA